ncbi:MAG TPA: cytochrome c oxidase subunit II [Steroidobacter sp.]|uniref:cytochrome c oxidase subunit II n=1 Tax=Steroidobacter sp. TaxID=1978227 RepID=UPI002EDB6C9F
MRIAKLHALGVSIVTSAWSSQACAVAWDLREGVTDMSRRIQALHHMSFTVCVIVGIVVFGAMFYSIFAHRRSRRQEPAHFHENSRLEAIWTLIPFLILVGMAIPATSALMEIEDNSDADLTVLITASQWKWHYQYVEAGFGYYSHIATPRGQIDNKERKGEHYLLEADQPLVLPTDKKVRFLTTARDVIHSWWVPDFGVKQDAVPGYINEAWTRVDKPGVYRGQCAELCGKDHAFMPIVVEVRRAADFDRWLAGQRQARALASQAAIAARNKQWTMAELLPLGEQVYLKHCATCHQADGVGQQGKYPALAGSSIVTGPIESHLNRVMNGKADTEMQAWAPQLSDVDLAAVITYERNSWGNDTGVVVQPLTVYSAR